MEQLAGTKFAVEAGALEQEVGAAAGPSHRLGFVHAPVDKEVCGPFRDRSTQTGAMALGIVDQPGALVGQVAVDLAHTASVTADLFSGSPARPGRLA